MKRKCQIMSICVILCLFVAGCATSGSLISSGYKVFATGAHSYTMAMGTINVLIDAGKINYADQVRIRKYDNLYRVAYHSAVRALEIYKMTDDAADKERLKVALTKCTGALSQFLDFVEPWIVKEVE